MISFLISCTASFSQTAVQEISAFNIARYEKRNFLKFWDLECASGQKKLHTVFIWRLETLRDISKEDFTSQDLLRHTALYFPKHQKHFPDNTCLIYNDSLRVIGTTDNQLVYCQFNKDEDDLLKFVLDQKPEFLFQLYGSSLGITFAKVKDEIYVLDQMSNPMSVQPVEEYAACCWDKMFPHGLNK